MVILRGATVFHKVIARQSDNSTKIEDVSSRWKPGLSGTIDRYTEVQMDQKRVVITGMGTVNPLGHSVPESWDALMAHKSGIAPITLFDASELNSRIAGEVKDFDYTKYFEGPILKKAKRMGRFAQLAVAATAEAMEAADLDHSVAPERIGVAVGSGIGALELQDKNITSYHQRGSRGISPFYIPMTIGNMAAGILSMMNGWKGPSFSVQSACATGNHSIAMSMMIIRNGMADVMVAGGTEGVVIGVAQAAFGNMQAISTNNDSPETASRPFDVNRDGFVLSEGAAILILEEYEHAKARGADIVCEVVSCGMTSDAYDFVAPDPEGNGAASAMRMALNQAGIEAKDVKYVNAHGTSTPVGDLAEAKAIYSVFGDADLYVGSTKSYHGHLLGATAGLEAILTAEAIRKGTVPANINLFDPDPQLPPLQLPTDEVQTDIPYALSNSFGFGGHNSSLLLRSV